MSYDTALQQAEEELAKAIGALPLPWGTPEIEAHLSRITRAKDQLMAAISWQMTPKGLTVKEAVAVAQKSGQSGRDGVFVAVGAESLLQYDAHLDVLEKRLEDAEARAAQWREIATAKVAR